jgi:bifunctional non-homologous end joining protein LigD
VPEPPAAREAPAADSAPRVEGAMQTPDGAWRVEALRSGATPWYRVVHAGNVVDWLTIADVERLLDRAGIDISKLRDAPAA